MERLIQKGSRKRYRSKLEIIKHKKKRKGKTAANWFMGGEIRNTLTSTITPGGDLAREIRDRLQAIQVTGNRSKIIETAGAPISTGLFKGDPFLQLGCPYRYKYSMSSS